MTTDEVSLEEFITEIFAGKLDPLPSPHHTQVLEQTLVQFGSIFCLIIAKSIDFFLILNSLHLASLRDNPNVLWVFYEDLITNLEENIEAIASITLDIDCSHHRLSFLLL